MRLDIDEKELITKFDKIFNAKKFKYGKVVSKLDALSPLNVMARGYSVTKKDDKIIKSATSIEIGEKFTLKFLDGEILAKREE